MSASDLNDALASERLRRGRGVDRARDRITWQATCDDLPSGTVVLIDGAAHRVDGTGVHRFSFGGWGEVTSMPDSPVAVLTPPTSVAALANGFVPVIAGYGIAG